MPGLSIQHVSKRYGSVRALDDICLDIEAGEIHAVLGENGAGKSTLMGVLSGFVRPDAGSVSVSGNSMKLGDAIASKRHGIEMVHQHFTLVPEFTVAENLALSQISTLYTVQNPLTLAEKCITKATELGWTIDTSAKVRDLPVGIQQRIEILKALAADAKILILDEPTAMLSGAEVRELFAVLRKLKAEGRTVLIIAHKLREIMEVADRVTVLRKGKWIATAAVAQTSEQELAVWMVGDLPPGLAIPSVATRAPRLDVQELQTSGGFDAAVSFQITEGEILGVGGVDGNGQVELAETVAGVRQPERGTISWKGQPGLPQTGYVPQDRQADGLALHMSVFDNLLISGHHKTAGPFLRLRVLRQWAEGLVQRFRIAIGSLKDPVGSLSGGNQQKVVVARALESEPELLVVVNPTRGLDIGAAHYVHEQLLLARERGASIMLVSNDLEELGALADRTVFMNRGRFMEGTDALAVVGGSD
jgi:simple sugar transport system ATP-binding protein